MPHVHSDHNRLEHLMCSPSILYAVFATVVSKFSRIYITLWASSATFSLKESCNLIDVSIDSGGGSHRDRNFECLRVTQPACID